MAISRYPLIAHEGWPYILGLGMAASAASYYYGIWSTPLWLLLPVVVWLYRDPARKIPSVPLALICPVDGKILSVEETRDPFRKCDAQCIRIEMPGSGIFTVRAPTEGKIHQHWFRKQGALFGERNYAVWIQTDEMDDVVTVLRPGRLLRQVNCYSATGERVGQGQRCGYIPFGAVVDVYIPVNAVVNVKTGDTVLSGETVLAELVRR